MEDTTITNEYFSLFKKYSQQYDKNKFIILMQVGKFYESYSCDEIGPDLIEISKILSIARVSKNKKKINDINNPYMLGFPTVSLIKNLEFLIDNYTVIIVDQIPNNNKNKKREVREVTNIYTKGTYIENINDKIVNYITSIYIYEEKQKTGNPLLCMGISASDLSTCKVFIHEAFSIHNDKNYALDEIVRFMTCFPSKEIILFYNQPKQLVNNKNATYIAKQTANQNIDIDNIISYLEINKNICRINNNIEPKFYNLSYQEEILKKIYGSTIVNPIEYLDLENKTFSIISLILLFDFINDKNNNLLSNLKKPQFYLNQQHLVLGNNAVSQLNIYNSNDNNDNNSSKIKSLFDVINCTSTPMGERYLKSMLASPMIDISEINKMYNLTESILQNNKINDIETYLDNIRDIERMERKIGLKLLKPYELAVFLNSYDNILLLNNILKEINLKEICLKKKTIGNIADVIAEIKNTFDITELSKYGNYEFKTSIFKTGIHSDIDKLIDINTQSNGLIVRLKDELEKLLELKLNGISIKNNNRDGTHFILSNQRAQKLLNIFKNTKVILINNIEINTDTLIFKEVGKNTKITFKNKINDINDNLDEIENLTKIYYIEFITNLFTKYNKTFNICNLFITNIDYIKSSAKVARTYNYTKPLIINQDNGYIKATNLRHPIVERIIDYEYIPHDIEIGNDLKGMLIFGLNSSGKSVLMKAIGISIILAQIGYFVPATSYTYSPYTAIYTRITGNDNIFKGLSSFSLEMVEINSILKRADKKTLIIGDEICRGTEHISGNAIVATTVLKLAELQSSFIFATHLHEISTLDEIVELEHVKSFHLKVDYDAIKDCLIYNRKLNEGSGEKVYGITVARHIIHDTEFIDKAISIKNKLMKKYDSLISGKKSSYNKNLYIHECNICGTTDSKYNVSPLETHHINFQKDCVNNFVKDKPHIQMNHQANLVVLCNACHDKIHSGKLFVIGSVMTSKGKNIIVN